MATQPYLPALPKAHQGLAASPSRSQPRTWPPVVLLGLFWAIYAVWRWTDLGMTLGFMGFLMLLGIGALVMILFTTWWLVASNVTWSERLLVLGAALGSGIAAFVLGHKMLSPFLLLPGIPMVLTTWTLGLIVARNWSPHPRGVLLISVVSLNWGAYMLLRAQGMQGDGQLTLRWRWTLTAEEVYLGTPEGKGQTTGQARATKGLTLLPGDWPAFRGPNRDGTLRGARIATNWDATPPKLLWQRRIGPAWSSVVIVGDRLFTQEQLGPKEAVACLDVGTGRTLWSHQDAARHEDVQGGAGPRATPTFADGRIFSLGAKGILNCLDAETGERQWSRDLGADTGNKTPMWGFSSSPLVIGDLVVVFAGNDRGEDDQTLLAYSKDTGKPAWSAQAGQRSYSSPQLASVGGEPQLLFVSERGLLAFHPSTGTMVWEHPTPPGNPGVPRAIQPRSLGANMILFDAGPDLGTALVELKLSDGSWRATQRWISRHLKPSFNDFVVHNNSIYGFDGLVFTCIDLQSGRRLWKEGRYGSGQVLLLGDQALLLVITDEGKAVLVAADPNEHRELGRFQAISGKTWNHPVIAHGRLYVRNAEEIACYAVAPAVPGAFLQEP
jgi:outer membrane protein assembly factor BamB